MIGGINYGMSSLRNENGQLALPGMRFSGAAADSEMQRTGGGEGIKLL